MFRPLEGKRSELEEFLAVGLLVGRADEKGEDRQAKPLFEVSLSTRSRRILGDRQPVRVLLLQRLKDLSSPAMRCMAMDERKSHADTVSEALKPGMIWHDPDKRASPPICRLGGAVLPVENPSIECFQTLVIMLPLWAEKANRSHSFTKPRTSDNNLIASYSPG